MVAITIGLPASGRRPALNAAGWPDDRQATTDPLAPACTPYRALEHALARYRTLAADPAIVSPALPRAPVKPGVRFEQAAALQRFLLALGDVEPDGTPVDDLYAGPLVDAVKRFQIRHGLDADGIIGGRTAVALSVPIAARVRQIELALERLRSLPHVGGPLVVVNIPMFQLWAWDDLDAAPALTARVIVGRARVTPTPVMIDQMEHVIFRPYWNVPTSILRKEILPKLSRDPDYLRREQMEIVSGEGDDRRRSLSRRRRWRASDVASFGCDNGPAPRTRSVGSSSCFQTRATSISMTRLRPRSSRGRGGTSATGACASTSQRRSPRGSYRINPSGRPHGSWSR